MAISNINNSNEALKFLEERIKSDDYRGIHLFQHYRYDINFIKTVLSELYSNEKNTRNKYLKIRTTDSSKRPENNADEIDYSNIVNNIKSKTGKGTQDAIRKIIFVDCNRMGLLDRYDKNKNLIPANKNSKGYSFVSISEKGRKFIGAKDLKEEYFIFSAGLYKIVGTLINILESLITTHDFKFISKYEFMYFVSAVDDNSSFSIDIDKCGYLIQQFRLLGDVDRKNVTKLLKKEMNPDTYQGNKKNKRDFANWENEASQIFLLLATTVYFEVRNRIKLILNQSDTSLESIIGKEFKKQRSLQEKNNYYSSHGVNSKILGFELHHVVALEYADSPALYKLLDNWQNMVYIDAHNHAKITQNSNRNVIMSASGDDLVLKDYSNNEVYLENKKNIAYKTKIQNTMLTYNLKLLNTVQ
ncbi:MAG: hypothetical protein AAB596_01985 [Patescibacteria group bacterium]